MALYLMQYKGKYRILPELDMETNDFPRDKNGNIAKGYEDIYIACRYGNKIYNYGHGVLEAYIPSIGRGRNVIKELDTKGIPYTDLRETDEEVLFRFKAKYIDDIAQLLKVKTAGADISPFSSKNLPKNKDVSLPVEELARYKEIIQPVQNLEGFNILTIHKATIQFLSTVLTRNIRKVEGKTFDYKTDMKKLRMGRMTKEYIYTKGMWEEYLKFLKTELSEYKN